jgi:hypothetical protein
LYGIFDSTRFAYPGSELDKTPRDMVVLQGNEMAYAVVDKEPHNVRLHRRGDPKDLGSEVPRRNLDLLGGQEVPAGAGSGRLQLADWIASPGNALAARVMVNRVWQYHFGNGLVRTPNDFGTRGERPTHPELLDHLAARFIAGGWSLKALHRTIMLSAAYGMSSGASERGLEVDADNRLLWRFPRRRLSAEELRDSVLAVSGALDRTPGGAHPFPAENTWGFTQHAPFIADYPTNKRSVYLMIQRIRQQPLLALFDGADPNTSTPARFATTVPTQALFFLNSPFMDDQAKLLAGRVLGEPDDAARLTRAYRLLFGRAPTEGEHAAAKRFLAAYDAELAGVAASERPATAWAAYVRVLLSTNEFLYVD